MTSQLHRSWQSCGIRIEGLRRRSDAFDSFGGMRGRYESYRALTEPNHEGTEKVEFNQGRVPFT